MKKMHAHPKSPQSFKRWDPSPLALRPCLRRQSHDLRPGDATDAVLGAGAGWLVKTLT